MNEIQHARGTFCWVELTTTDAASAKSFYTGLMGWEAEDDSIPGGGVYTMLRVGEKNVGGLYGMNEQMKGVPPHWMLYVTVESAVEAAAKAKSLGGTVVKDAFDVMDVGSMAVLQDPTGATFAVWQPKRHHGTQLGTHEIGSACWHELATNDVERAGKFYSELFGWTLFVSDMPTGPYTMFMNGEVHAGGMLQMTAECEGIPSHWMVYFAVADCDASAADAKSRGGQIKVPPTDIPGVGRFSVVQDPQGAVCSIIRLETPARG